MISKPLIIFSGILVFSVHTLVLGEEFSVEKLPAAMQRRAVVIDMTARVLEQNSKEVWNASASRATIPGRPVALKLVGTNLVVELKFTPYRLKDGRPALVAQGQIWIDVPNQGIRYQTTMETIPLDFGERIYFFPLGPEGGANRARIEVQVELHHYLDYQPAPALEGQPAPTPAAAGETPPGEASQPTE